MCFTLIFAIAVTAQANTRPDDAPIELERGFEIEMLDREIQRQHDTVLVQRGKHTTAQRLTQRGVASLGDVKRASLDLQFHEAREVELNAFRALKVYERDTVKKANPPDESKAYSLILAWVRAQASVAEIDVAHRSFALDLARVSPQGNPGRQLEIEDAEIAYRSAAGGLAVCRAREAQVLLAMTDRKAEKADDSADVRRLKAEYIAARIRAAEIQLETAQRRFEIARARINGGMMPLTELQLFEKAISDASSALEAEKKAQESEKAEPKPKSDKAV